MCIRIILQADVIVCSTTNDISLDIGACRDVAKKAGKPFKKQCSKIRYMNTGQVEAIITPGCPFKSVFLVALPYTNPNTSQADLEVRFLSAHNSNMIVTLFNHKHMLYYCSLGHG